MLACVTTFEGRSGLEWMDSRLRGNDVMWRMHYGLGPGLRADSAHNDAPFSLPISLATCR